MSLRLLILLAALTATAAHAEKGDRLKPMVFTSDKTGVIDGVNQRTELQGNVIITQGSLVMSAEKVDVRETRDGYVQAYASGATGKPVSFRQARDQPGEAIEGVADQLEYDTRTENVRFIGNANVRSTRGATIANEVTGAVIVYNSRTEVFTLEGGSASPNPNGRTRIVLMPRPQPADDAASAPPAPLPLKPSTTLQPGKPL
ncbi:lipopolysaccharide transport periplasmic protein LptA [Roseateles sp.]|uniref:lipopolysaccharide transport periplasmic protein LptA n=1 Tax=Roseateles sp. TaxID=1971397 RepID=UPI003263FB8B